jgi:iron-sulfur cluster repair protein YtfE (RIC family)
VLIMITYPVTEPLRVEHRQLAPHIDELAHTATWVSTAPPPVVREKLQGALDFLRHHLVPHALAEEDVLYPAVEGAMRAPGATETMRRDHAEVLRRVEELEQLRDEIDDAPTEAQCDLLAASLHGLHAIVSLHFAKEEEIYLPILDRALTTQDAEVLFERLEAAERSHR